MPYRIQDMIERDVYLFSAIQYITAAQSMDKEGCLNLPNKVK
jgi:hypothetical protein